MSDSSVYYNCRDHFSPIKEASSSDKKLTIDGRKTVVGILFVKWLEIIHEKIVKRSFNCIRRPLVSLASKLIAHSGGVRKR